MVFDVGETLIDESRIFQRWAERLGVPRLSFLGTLGAVLHNGGSPTDAIRLVRPDVERLDVEIAAWRRDEPDSLTTGFDSDDLYPDVRPTLDALRAQGLSLIIAGNQPSEAGPALAAMRLPVDSIHVSEDWGVEKPDPRFFERVRDVAGVTSEEILYVGDRLDNDVIPGKAAGMRTVLLRRGPFGYLHSEQPEAKLADVILDGLDGLPAFIAHGN
ncbi:HAD family hydrolase [Spiractinospora alimapuensis]|nr:HAD family hydrolase [Spiractinospora alimapuensis]